MDLKKLEVWFVTGSQHLYGEETLKQVAEHSQTIVKALNNGRQIPVIVVFRPTVKSPEEIYASCPEPKTTPNCIAIVPGTRTFSPATMWLGRLRILPKPPAHLHT